MPLLEWDSESEILQGATVTYALLVDSDGEEAIARELVADEAANDERPLDGKRGEEEVDGNGPESIASEEDHQEAEAREESRVHVEED